MAKKQIRKLKMMKNLIFPYPVVLVGANVREKPNYMAVGLIGWLCYDTISVSIGHKQYTRRGIVENGTFSVNQPSSDMMAETDYCGTYSGRRTNKARLFTSFYGSLKTAPMIDECPVNIECRVIQTLERPIHTVFIGEVVSVYMDTAYSRRGVPDVEKIKPLFYAPVAGRGKTEHNYYTLSDRIGRAWHEGKKIKVKGKR